MQVGIYDINLLGYAANPTFSGLTLMNNARNLKTVWNFEDFIEGVTAASAHSGIWSTYNAGAASGISDKVGTTLRPGIIWIFTGTAANGYAGIYTGRNNSTSFALGAGVYTFETDINLSQLSAVLDEFTLRIGFGDTGAADHIDGCYFEYDRVANVNWLRCTAANSARTKADTGVAVQAGAWVRLKVVVNADATSVEFFINGISVGVNVLNIPSGAARELSCWYDITKSVGATNVLVSIDWAWIHIDLTTSR